MIDSFKSRWSMLSPKHKTYSMYGLIFLVITICIFGLSSEPIKKDLTPYIPNQIGVFEVDDESVTLEALGTAMKAQDEKISLLQEQLKASNKQNLKDREIIKSLTGSDKSFRTINELSKKVSRVEEMIGNVANRQDLLGPYNKEDDSVYVENVSEPEEKTENDVVDSPSSIASSVKRESKPVISNQVHKTSLPDDPLAFIKSVSSKNQTDSDNIFIKSEAPQNQPELDNYRNNGQIEVVTTSEELTETIDENTPVFVGERIMAGSLIPIVVVSGVDAPTGKAAEKGAISSTLRVTGPTILPNGYRVDLTGCLVTAEVRGDTATERAYFRPNRLTCVFDYGSVDIPLKGYTSGKDGVQGFRGRVVSKQGKALFYGSIAGAVQGIGDAFGGGSSSNRGIQIDNGDPFALPDSGDVAQAAAAGAVSESAEFLTDYYKTKLDSLYEIIEIKPLITGSIHVLETFQLELLDELVKKKKK